VVNVNKQYILFLFMNTEFSDKLKRVISQAMLVAVLGAAALFVYSLFLPKQWLVTGKVVVFPSGLASAQRNLGYEVGNTVEIVNSDTFKKRVFQGRAQNFAGAKNINNSSVISAGFISRENDIKSYEDLLVKLPGEISNYTRDLYDGSPYKYKLLSDPEISVGPVKPNVIQNVSLGFLGGLALYFIYWLFFDLLRAPIEKPTAEVKTKVGEVEKPEVFGAEKPAEPQIIAKPKEEVVKEKKAEVKAEEPGPKPSDGTVPSNLPIGKSVAEEEPSDEEIKERLNRLMRGEL